MSRGVIDSKRLAEVRSLYSGQTNISQLAAMLDLSIAGFYRLRRRDGWGPWPGAQPVGRQPKRRVASPKQEAHFDANEVGGLIEAAVERGLANAAQDLGQPGSAEAERNARMLASLTKTLGELRRLQSSKTTKSGKGRNGQVERPARDMATLRADIARRIEEALRTGPVADSTEEPERR